jgi:hypothetical protein
MYETGHIAVGIILGILIGHAIRDQPVIPIIALLCVLPDIDMLPPFRIKHGGLTHSIILITLSFFPFLMFYGIKVLPYLVAALSHPIGDLPFGSVKIIWPLSIRKLGLGETITINSNIHIAMESLSLLIAFIFLIRTDELILLLKPLKINLLLLVPLSSLIATILLKPKSLLPIPISITLLHIIQIVIFSLSFGLALK